MSGNYLVALFKSIAERGRGSPLHRPPGAPCAASAAAAPATWLLI